MTYDKGRISGVAIAIGNDAGVDTRSISMPEVHVKTRGWLAGAYVDELDVDIQRDTLLILADIRAHILTNNICTHLSELGVDRREI
jgi:hypothetical protein